MTPLIYAVRLNRMEIVKFLLQNNADINIGIKIFDNQGSEVIAENVTPLIVAILTDNMDMVKILTEAGADINLNATEYTDSGFDVLYSPLMVAIEKDNFDTVKYLVDHGANINFIANQETAPTTNIYITPVTTAIKHDQFKTLKFLVGQGASLQGASNYAGVFPPSWEIIEYLSRNTSDDGTKTLKQMLQLRNAFIDIVSKITQKLEFKETDFHMISGTNLHAAISMLSLIALTPEESRETFFKKNISTESLISAFHYAVRELNYRNQLFEETTEDSLKKITNYFATKTSVRNPDDFNTYCSEVLNTKFRMLVPLVFKD